MELTLREWCSCQDLSYTPKNPELITVEIADSLLRIIAHLVPGKETIGSIIPESIALK